MSAFLALVLAAPQAVAGGVVVSGSRTQDELIATVANDVNVIGRETLDEEGVSQVNDAARTTAGAKFQETNPGAGLVMLRGMVGPDVLIMLDGIRYNTSTFRTGPNQYLGLLGAFALDRVEVSQGPSSVLYGSGAMGGVVNLVTRSFDAQKNPNAARFELMAQGLNGGDAALLLQRGDKAGHLIASLHHRQVIERNAGGLLAGDDHFVPLANVNQADVLLKGYRRMGALRLSGGYLGLATFGGGRLDRVEQGDIRRYNNEDHFGWTKLTHRGQGLLRTSTAFVGVRHLSESIRRDKCHKDGSAVRFRGTCIDSFDQPLDPSFANHLKERRQYDDSVLMVQGGAQTLFRPFGTLKLRVGAEWAEEWVNSGEASAKASEAFVFADRERGNFVDGSRYHSGGLYTTGRIRLMNGTRKLDWNVGARYAMFAANAPAGSGLDEAIEFSQSGLVGQTSIISHGGTGPSVWIGANQGFRAPNLQESTVLGDTGSKFEVPNPDLGPQRADSVELGLRQVQGKVTGSLVGYYMALSDIIDEAEATYHGASEVDGAPVVQRVNARSGEVYGVNLKVDWRGERWTERNHFAWTEGSVEREDVWVSMRRKPPIQGHHSLSYRINKAWSASVGVNWAVAQADLHPSDRKDLRICADPSNPSSVYADEDCPGSPAWFRMDAAANYRPSGDRSIRIGIENLTDTRYKTHGSGTFAPGMTARLSFQQAF